MIPSLDPVTTVLIEALRSLERALDESRSQWNDVARRTFDIRHGDRILADGRQTTGKVEEMTRELADAARMLSNLDRPA